MTGDKNRKCEGGAWNSNQWGRRMFEGAAPDSVIDPDLGFRLVRRLAPAQQLSEIRG
jgi:hypothetical protein